MKPHAQTLTGMIERILAIVERVAEDMGLPIPKSDEEEDSEPNE